MARRSRRQPLAEGSFDNRPEALKHVRVPMPGRNGGGAHRDKSRYSRKRKHRGEEA